MKADADLGVSGFKTLAVCVAVDGGPTTIAETLPITTEGYLVRMLVIAFTKRHTDQERRNASRRPLRSA